MCSRPCGRSAYGIETYSLREDLWVVTLGDLPDLILGSLGVDDPVLSFDPVLDLLPELLFDYLVLVQQASEPRLGSFDLSLLSSVAFCHLEQLLDLTLALFSGGLGLLVQLVGSGGSLRVGGGLGLSAWLQSVSL